MEITKGYEYTLDGVEGLELDMFAKGVLALVNIKSSRKETIADVRTVEGMNRVIVIAYVDLDEYIASNSHVWEVCTKEPMNIVTAIEFKESEVKALDKILYQDEEEVYFTNLEF